MKRFTSLITVCLAGLVLSACASTRNLPSLPPAPSTQYQLDTGDRIRLDVFGEERISNTYTVGDQGQISVPLIGEVTARGRTVNQLETAVEQELAKGIVVSPSVSVQIEEYRPFFILGEVERPGKYPYVEGMTVLSAVAVGGGFTFRAEKNAFEVTRTVDGQQGEFAADRDAVVLPGDVIFVRERYL
ncbi:MAG: polysaccharide biosynthesis/export family protein [Pseudomonadota bacterium]